ncbi:hypothetical protein [Paenibacillus sp. OAE614]|uniref:hypothetical protein n=1 Tax=Paenibacillus sp. OAE614 TaxID=2663804 RepID=UPI00178A7298
MIYSRRTIIESLDLLEIKTNADIDQFAITYDIQEYAVGTSKTHKVNGIRKYLTNGKAPEELVIEAVSDLIERELRRLEKMNSWGDGPTLEQEYPKLMSLLRQDGFNIVDYKLVRELPESLTVWKYESELFTLLDKYSFLTCRGHLEQAIDNHAIGNWAAANAQMRAFMEGLFDAMADKIFGDRVKDFSSTTKRDWLGKTIPPILDPALNEIEEQGKNFSNGFMKRLHPEGAHAGLSNLEDSTFRLHLVILVASHYLRKFDQGVTVPNI